MERLSVAEQQLIEVRAPPRPQRDGAHLRRTDGGTRRTRDRSGQGGRCGRFSRLDVRSSTSPTDSTRCSNWPIASPCSVTAARCLLLQPQQITLDELISMMLGGSLAALFPARDRTRCGGVGGSRASSEQLAAAGRPRRPARVRSSVSPGNSVAERAMSCRAIAGHQTTVSGHVAVVGETVPSGSPAAAVGRGIGYSSSNRKRDGLFLHRTVVENLTAPALGKVSRRGWLRRGIERRISDRIAAHVHHRPRTVGLASRRPQRGQSAEGRRREVDEFASAEYC